LVCICSFLFNDLFGRDVGLFLAFDIHFALAYALLLPALPLAPLAPQD